MTPLRKARLMKELSIHHVSQLTNISPSKLSLVERDYSHANPEEQKKLARILGAKVKDLFPTHGGSNAN